MFTALSRASSYASDFICHGSTWMDSWTGISYHSQQWSESIPYRKVHDLHWIVKPHRTVIGSCGHYSLLPMPSGEAISEVRNASRLLAAKLILQIHILHSRNIYGQFDPEAIYVQNDIPVWFKLKEPQGRKLNDWLQLAELVSQLYPDSKALHHLLYTLIKGHVELEKVMRESFFEGVQWGDLWNSL